ncbi:hypothetical protein [uncultured Methylovirgula sp.]|uniref:hypothetical protein n=1 Tax=uncultured Methylovirgula sp. TaxID=1285960 RepID=UPI0026027BF5|nr:hypothetical protein [uncultured Methylovirgula sp.]
MKYALFGLGMVLIIVGGYFLYTGSNIVEVERGWSAVIAGTTALTGGIITLGLAGVVMSLEDMKRLWVSAPLAREAGAASLAAETSAAATMEIPVAPNLGPVPAAAEVATATEVELEVVRAAEEGPAPAPGIFPRPLRKAWPRPKPEFTTRAPAPAEASPAIAELRRRVAEDLNLDWPSFTAPPVVPIPEPLPETLPGEPESTEAVKPPPLGLDDFDNESGIGRESDADRETRAETFAASEIEPGPEEAPPPPIAATPEPVAPSEPEPVAAESAKPAPKAIGRYEADGTIYVMFADGSIEAQSAQGTRRFKSMADLKASFQS